MSELDKIKLALKRNKSALKRQFKVKALGVFGSYARGKQKKTATLISSLNSAKPPAFSIMSGWKTALVAY